MLDAGKNGIITSIRSLRALRVPQGKLPEGSAAISSFTARLRSLFRARYFLKKYAEKG
jgi:hypothetical protein